MQPKSEAEIQQLIQMEGPKHACILMRNNSGALKDAEGRLVRYGLGNTTPNQEFASSDLIGITTITITPEMVGQKIGVFTAIEVKREDWKPSLTDKREKKQWNFIEWVRARGGFADMVNSVQEFKRLF